VKTLSLKEQSLISRIISAARQRNWQMFRTLSDEPFENESSMAEQFYMSADQLAGMNEIKFEAEAVEAPDGSRMVHANIIDAEPDSGVISLVVRSALVAGENRFGIWVFAPMPKW
jgi:hypothetical protein